MPTALHLVLAVQQFARVCINQAVVFAGNTIGFHGVDMRREHQFVLHAEPIRHAKEGQSLFN